MMNCLMFSPGRKMAYLRNILLGPLNRRDNYSRKSAPNFGHSAPKRLTGTNLCITLNLNIRASCTLYSMWSFVRCCRERARHLRMCYLSYWLTNLCCTSSRTCYYLISIRSNKRSRLWFPQITCNCQSHSDKPNTFLYSECPLSLGDSCTIRSSNFIPLFLSTNSISSGSSRMCTRLDTSNSYLRLLITPRCRRSSPWSSCFGRIRNWCRLKHSNWCRFCSWASRAGSFQMSLFSISRGRCRIRSFHIGYLGSSGRYSLCISSPPVLRSSSSLRRRLGTVGPRRPGISRLDISARRRPNKARRDTSIKCRRSWNC